MSNWQTELITGIQDFRRKFEGAEEHVGNRPMVKREYDQALARLREAEVAVSAFVDVYDDESRK
jgi:predicted methyltransferase